MKTDGDFPEVEQFNLKIILSMKFGVRLTRNQAEGFLHRMDELEAAVVVGSKTTIP